MRGTGPVAELGAFAEAFGLLFRAPAIMLGPILAALLNVTLTLFVAPLFVMGPASEIAGLAVSIVSQIITGVGLALSIAIADYAMRSARSPFASARDTVQRRFGDIAIAALGFGFVVYVAAFVGANLGPFVSFALEALALFFFIFTLPAATIGGAPGAGALQISLDRAQRNRTAAVFAALGYIIVYYFLTPNFVGALLLPLAASALNSFAFSTYIVFAVNALVQGVCGGYLAGVLAKLYNDASYGRRFY